MKGMHFTRRTAGYTFSDHKKGEIMRADSINNRIYRTVQKK
jgi:hypothetical protein